MRSLIISLLLASQSIAHAAPTKPAFPTSRIGLGLLAGGIVLSIGGVAYANMRRTVCTYDFCSGVNASFQEAQTTGGYVVAGIGLVALLASVPVFIIDRPAERTQVALLIGGGGISLAGNW